MRGAHLSLSVRMSTAEHQISCDERRPPLAIYVRNHRYQQEDGCVVILIPTQANDVRFPL